MGRTLPVVVLALPLAFAGGAAADDGAPGGAVASMPATTAGSAAERGAYLFHAAGCQGCHTASEGGGEPLAGGRALKTPFGTFYTPNITPDPANGIGRWSDADFIRAFREGVRPDGTALYPAFPYASYTLMTDGDLLDLKAYLFAQTAAAAPNKPHDLSPPFSWRFLLPAWQWMYLTPGPRPDEPARPAAWNRGRYLVDALGHCGECHTPRNLLGAMEADRYLAGNPDGPDGDKVPNVTGATGKGIGGWSDGDLTLLLETGLTPEGDVVGGAMGEVVRNSTSKLTAEDRAAIAAYLKTVPAVE
ncbi:cytochrome c [Azospirillum picis]|uniref:Mono/diheme cytochrome c family protein n=1 Tax=Azospirillum picis TaxID=488438 RepID=A0ABU0MNR1_9PROT|nr:cytochrome c [Azospirillum picis]MBP2301264.1 mono/diheme cytochrome c family protein [Azospirillum picis]MDQ0535095.1 mono/diheme cytochrome c family protein [Azospirillum picis]